MNNVLTTIKKELRGIIRDKKTLLMMLLTPLLIPIFTIVMSYIYDNINNKNVEYNVGINYVLTDEEKKIVDSLDINLIYYETKDEQEKAYENGAINAYVIRENNNYLIYANEDNQDSLYASQMFSKYLESYNTYLANNYLQNIGADLNKVYHNIDYSFVQLKGKKDLVNLIISMGFIFCIMSITLVATYCTIDSTAGEKERGTLETFLTFPIKSNEIITGKYLAIVISCIVTSIISVIFVIGSLGISYNIFEIYKDASISFNFITISLGLLIMIIYSLFISGICIAIASMSKSYKEAQSALTPISMLTMIPMFLELIGITLTPLLSLIPVLSQVMLLENIFCDRLTSSVMLNIGIMFVSTIIYTIIIIKYISNQYKSEKILFSI